METERILVTGGKGFIGTHLAAELSKRGHEVRVCDLMPGNVIGGRDKKAS